MADAITIRDATLADLGALTSLKQLAARRAYAPFADPAALEQWLTARAGASSIKNKIGDPEYDVLVATDSFGDIVGMAAVRVPEDSDTANLGDLYCHEDSTGVGSALYARCKSVATSLLANKIVCHCFENNERAQKFFADRGFRVARRVTATDDLGAGALLELELSL